MLFRTIGVLFALMALGAVAHADRQDDAAERSYYLHVSEQYDGDEAVPLLVALHPSASSGRAMAALTGLNDLADEENFIVVYPEALDMWWDDGRDKSTLVSDIGDDMAFIPNLIDELSAEYNISEVDLVGWGTGGSMAYRLACTMPERFESIAVVSVLLWETQIESCADDVEESANMLVMHGTADPIYTPGGADWNGQMLLGVGQTMEFWAERMGCAADAFIVPEDRPNVRLNEDCNGKHLAYYGIAGGGASWPRTGDYRLNQFGIDATQIIGDFISGAPAWATAQPEPYTQRPRSYVVYVPSGYDPNEPLPVVFTFHGRPSTGTSMAYITNMQPIAEAENFIVVFPDGLDNQWHYVEDIAFYPQQEYSDFEFLRDLIDDLAIDLNIDRNRLYATGFSNGGFMTQRLACEMSDTFAAFAAAGSQVFAGLPSVCPENGNVPMLLMHGTDDISIPWDGIPQQVGGEAVALSVDGTATFWTDFNECERDSEITDIPASGTTQVRILELTDCPEGAAVILYGIMGGGHNWPGFPGRISDQIAGEVNTDINANQVVWDFVSRYTLDG